MNTFLRTLAATATAAALAAPVALADPSYRGDAARAAEHGSNAREQAMPVDGWSVRHAAREARTAAAEREQRLDMGLANVVREARAAATEARAAAADREYLLDHQPVRAEAKRNQRLDTGLANVVRETRAAAAEARAAAAEHEYLLDHLVHPRANSLPTSQASDRPSPDRQSVATSQRAAVATSAAGFDWGAAGIGAGLVLGLMLLGLIALGLVRYRQPTGT